MTTNRWALRIYNRRNDGVEYHSLDEPVLIITNTANYIRITREEEKSGGVYTTHMVVSDNSFAWKPVSEEEYQTISKPKQ